MLAPLLLIELGLALYFFFSDLLGFVLPLFAAGAVSTLIAYVVLVHRWPLASSAWARFALALACAFVAFQVGLVAFAVVSASHLRANALGFTLAVLIGANVFFFPVWLLLGALAYGLLRLTEPEPAARPERPLPPRPRRRPPYS